MSKISLGYNISSETNWNVDWKQLKWAAEASDAKLEPLAPNDHLYGIPIYVEEDPNTRRALAVRHFFATGRPVVFEDKQGNLVQLIHPKPSDIFPTTLINPTSGSSTETK